MEATTYEGIRRSAAMGPLPPSAVTELIEACGELLTERARIREILAGLGDDWAGVKTGLNQLHQIVS
jgi:hypothetical protein